MADFKGTGNPTLRDALGKRPLNSRFFFGVRARLRGVGVNVLPQALHRRRAVPEGLVPNLMTPVLSPHAGQEIATMKQAAP